MYLAAILDFAKYLETPTGTKNYPPAIFKGTSWTAQINNKNTVDAKLHRTFELAPTKE